MTDYSEIATRFARDTAQHDMTALHDDGLYRHVRFAPKESSLFWWDLITWPYNLIVNGSHGSFHFCRFGEDTKDMFVLFRDSRAGGSINPEYWEEKLRAGKAKDWSESKFRSWLVEEAAALEARYPGTVEAIGRQILNSDEHDIQYEETARYACGQFRHGDVTLRFPDEWDLSFEEFDWQYLWQCHAIVSGIARYDAAKAAAPRRITAIRKVQDGDRWRVKWRLDGRPRVRTFTTAADARDCQRYVMAQAAEGDRRG